MSDGSAAVGASRPQVIFTINGPGEISAWLYPLSLAIKARCPEAWLCVCLLPCVFSTGAEVSVLEEIESIDAVCSVRQSFDLILRNRMPDGFERDAPTLVFHLGGEIALTVLMGRRLRAGMFSYVEAPFFLQGRFRKVFFNELNALPAKYADRSDALVGELMVDAARLRRDAGAAKRKDGVIVGLFPGSRSYMVKALMPFYAVTVDRIARERPDVTWVMAKSDFVSLDLLKNFPPPPEDRTWNAHRVRYRSDGNLGWMETDAGTRIEILTNRDVLAIADYALTIPGTNTGEIAASGIPFVLVLPTYLGELAPLPGLAGHLGRIPVIGKRLKLWLGHRMLARLPLLAQPNRRAGRMIVPEIVGKDLDERIHAAMIGMMDDTAGTIAQEVQQAMGAPGAANRIADEVVDFLTACGSGRGAFDAN